jgi:WD40-like Beta Propeller Repeat
MKNRLVAAGLATAVVFGIGQASAASGGAVPVTFEDPAWSPNGKLIALTSNRDDASSFPDVYVMNADGAGCAA